MEQTEKKYRINELLARLNVKDHRKALRVLPAELGISVATFNNYRYIKVDDAQDIPHTMVLKMEQFFGVPAGSLKNFSIETRCINDFAEPGDNNYNLSKKQL